MVEPRRYTVIPEMMWKQDEQVEIARRAPGWADFHRTCGRHNLYFDHVERVSKRGPYKAVAYALDRHGARFTTVHVAEGMGRTPIDAIADAYRRSGQAVADNELAVLLNPGGDELDMEDLLG